MTKALYENFVVSIHLSDGVYIAKAIGQHSGGVSVGGSLIDAAKRNSEPQEAKSTSASSAAMKAVQMVISAGCGEFDVGKKGKDK